MKGLDGLFVFWVLAGASAALEPRPRLKVNFVKKPARAVQGVVQFELRLGKTADELVELCQCLKGLLGLKVFERNGSMVWDWAGRPVLHNPCDTLAKLRSQSDFPSPRWEDIGAVTSITDDGLLHWLKASLTGYEQRSVSACGNSLCKSKATVVLTPTCRGALLEQASFIADVAQGAKPNRQALRKSFPFHFVLIITYACLR
jgi:hypothetical protein